MVKEKGLHTHKLSHWLLKKRGQISGYKDISHLFYQNDTRGKEGNDVKSVSFTELTSEPPTPRARPANSRPLGAGLSSLLQRRLFPVGQGLTGRPRPRATRRGPGMPRTLRPPIPRAAQGEAMAPGPRRGCSPPSPCAAAGRGGPEVLR